MPSGEGGYEFGSVRSVSLFCANQACPDDAFALARRLAKEEGSWLKSALEQMCMRTAYARLPDYVREILGGEA